MRKDLSFVVAVVMLCCSVTWVNAQSILRQDDIVEIRLVPYTGGAQHERLNSFYGGYAWSGFLGYGGYQNPDAIRHALEQQFQAVGLRIASVQRIQEVTADRLYLRGNPEVRQNAIPPKGTLEPATVIAEVTIVPIGFGIYDSYQGYGYPYGNYGYGGGKDINIVILPGKTFPLGGTINLKKRRVELRVSLRRADTGLIADSGSTGPSPPLQSQGRTSATDGAVYTVRPSGGFLGFLGVGVPGVVVNSYTSQAELFWSAFEAALADLQKHLRGVIGQPSVEFGKILEIAKREGTHLVIIDRGRTSGIKENETLEVWEIAPRSGARLMRLAVLKAVNVDATTCTCLLSEGDPRRLKPGQLVWRVLQTSIPPTLLPDQK